MAMNEYVKKITLSIRTELNSIRFDFYLFAVLVLFSIVGIGLTDAYGKWSKWYWFLMVPVFLGSNLLIEWHAAKQNSMSLRPVFFRQLQYWAGIFGAQYLTFFLEQIGSLNNETTGMILLLILALSTYMIGISSGLLFQLLGVFLGICLVIVAYVENYTWVVLGLTVIVLIAYYYLSKNLNQLKNSFHY